MLLGVDVSGVQGTSIDWTRAAAAGVHFAIAKATDGEAGIDSAHATNARCIKAAGIRRGAYHFGDPRRDPTKQAIHFADVVGDLDDDDLPPTLDLEIAQDLGGKVILDWVRAFLSVAEFRFARTLMIYTGIGYWQAIGDPVAADLGARPLWVAHYTLAPAPALPRPWRSWRIWQRSGNLDGGRKPGLRVDGIPTVVDADYFDGDAGELAAFVASTIRTPKGPTIAPAPDAYPLTSSILEERAEAVEAPPSTERPGK